MRALTNQIADIFSPNDNGIYNISSTPFVENNVIAVRKSKPIFIEKVSHSPHDASYTVIKLIIGDHPSPCDIVTSINSENIQKYVLKSLP